jgi:aminopeptidase
MFKGPMTGDYKEVAALTKKVGDLVTKANKATITSPSGTNLTIYLEDRAAWLDTGIFHKPGDRGNLPAGEAYVAPEEDKGDGILILEPVSSMVEDYTKVVLENGRIIEIEESLSGKNFRNFLEAAGENSFIIAELGIGTNPKAEITGNLLEDEKVIDTCHVAFGHNLTFGGKNKANTHIDFLITEPTLKLEIEGKKVVLLDKGKLSPP